ncbi:TraR/DksA family transcriptional regulator [Altererythrobacter confluentis]|uniref:TraR/DksA family transcriptional regulator n=1 Tax=Allopontixanthobacter confluentis TaxID=1849021 RepID=A0A6L7GGN3_9SPHN|nr:TraR/DksA family transcriptional regulator [Allopontixanthobacter confluentis]MXP13821.1 TraR/DksA family transcriptional regulator [Allopontixanthobacter confluentis]
MTEYAKIAEQLTDRLAQLVTRAEVIEDDLRHPLDADWAEQAIDLADDEALAGVDEVLRNEIQQIRLALLRIENGTYGTCAKCGKEIGLKRLEARPIATRCIKCASA